MILMPSAVSAKPAAPLEREPRVRRTPVTRFAELSSKEKTAHAAWRLSLLNGSGRPARPVDSNSLRELVSALMALTSALAELHGTPDLGNKRDPVDELVYIVLSRRTREGAYQDAFKRLKAAFRTWEDLADAPDGEIENLIAFSGLGRRKARSLKLALGTLRDRFGECTLEPTRVWSDEETASFLCTLPEVGPKSAACIMMCALDRPAFPVDAHVGRVLERVGVFRSVGIELAGLGSAAMTSSVLSRVPMESVEFAAPGLRRRGSRPRGAQGAR